MVDYRVLPERALLIWGAGGHASVVADVARAAGWSIVGYADRSRGQLDAPPPDSGGLLLLDEAEFLSMLDASARPFSAVALGLGDNAARLAAYECIAGRTELPPLVHPSAVVSPSAAVGPATVVMPQSVVNASARVAAAGILNTACVIEHDCQLDDGVHISPSATLAGSVKVGRGTWVGAGACVIQSVSLGACVVVGAGAVVLRDVRDGAKVVGCPARELPGA